MRKLDAPTRWALWTLLLIAPLYLLASHFGYDDRGFAAGIFIASVGFAARAQWDSRRRATYWIAVVVLVVVHIPLVMLLPWPTWHLSGAAHSPIGFLDFFVNYAVIRGTLVATNRRRHDASFVGEMPELSNRTPRQHTMLLINLRSCRLTMSDLPDR